MIFLEILRSLPRNRLRKITREVTHSYSRAIYGKFFDTKKGGQTDFLGEATFLKMIVFQIQAREFENKKGTTSNMTKHGKGNFQKSERKKWRKTFIVEKRVNA